MNQRDFEKKVTLCEQLLNMMVQENTNAQVESKTTKRWPFKAPEGFLKRSNLNEKEVQVFEIIRQCVRCAREELATGIRAALLHFVCDSCFKDTNEWTFKGKGDCVAYSIQEMRKMTLASNETDEDA